jgi:hypothetical protein
VIGINFGGVFAGRLAACFAKASLTYSFDTIGGKAVVVVCLNGLPRIIHLLTFTGRCHLF